MTNGNDLSFGQVTWHTADGGGMESGTLTKREYFAAVAMQGMISCGYSFNEAVEKSTQYADALIEQLNKNSGV